MKLTLKNLIIAGCLAAFIMPLFATSPSDADKRKAEYAFMEAISKKDDDLDACYALLQHAAALDPDNPVINYYVGLVKLNSDNITVDEFGTAMTQMRQITVERPKEYSENNTYAMINASMGNYDEAVRVMESLINEYPSKTELYPTLASCYAKQGKFDQAIAAIDSLENTDGRTVWSTSTKAGYLYSLGDTTATIACGRDLIKEAPKSTASNAVMGNIFAQVGMADSAIVYYRRALQIDPDYGYANLQMAYLYNSLGDSTNYEKEITATLLNKTIEVDTKVEILNGYIRDCIQQGDSSARVDNMFRTILNQHPHEAQLRLLFCDYLTFKKDYDNAAEQLSYALDIDPSDSKSWERLIWLYLFNNNAPKAIETGKKAIDYMPDEVPLYRALGAAYFNDKKYQKAIETYDTLLVRNHDMQILDDADIYAALGDTYQQMGDSVKTVESYEKSLELNPGNAMTLNNYAYYLLINVPSRLDDAVKMAEMAIAAEPDNDSFLDTYAWAMFLKRDYKKALEYIEKAAEKSDSDDPTMWEHYGDILFMLGKPAEAVEKWKEAQKLNPDSKLLKKKIDNKTYFYE